MKKKNRVLLILKKFNIFRWTFVYIYKVIEKDINVEKYNKYNIQLYKKIKYDFTKAEDGYLNITKNK